MAPEDELTEEEQARVAQLSDRDLELIDAFVMSHAGNAWRKVALVVALAMDSAVDKLQTVPDAFYSKRVALLVSQGKLESFGDLRRM